MEARLARIIGTEKDKILSAINAALYDKQKLPTESPYGDGYAAKRIV